MSGAATTAAVFEGSGVQLWMIAAKAVVADPATHVRAHGVGACVRAGGSPAGAHSVIEIVSKSSSPKESRSSANDVVA